MHIYTSKTDIIVYECDFMLIKLGLQARGGIENLRKIKKSRILREKIMKV